MGFDSAFKELNYHHALKIYDEVEVYFLVFLTSITRFEKYLSSASYRWLWCNIIYISANLKATEDCQERVVGYLYGLQRNKTWPGDSLKTERLGVAENDEPVVSC